MKKYLLSIFLLCNLHAQTEYVNTDHRVYNFLERMDNLMLITNYNQFELPKTRKEIADYLKKIISVKKELDESDQKLFDDFIIEFEYEISGSTLNSESIIDGDLSFSPDKSKYLFSFIEKPNMTLFVNLIAESELIAASTGNKTNMSTAVLLNAGGEIRGTFLEKLGFYLRGTNGVANGDRKTAKLKKELHYNFKYNEKPNEKFFDETQAYVTADFDLVKLKLGRDRLNLGYGVNKAILGNNSPMFDYLSFKCSYKFFNFSYIHGKLLGESAFSYDTITGSSNNVDEKYFVYHRIGFNISRHFNFGAGEVVIYGERGIDLSYSIPFSFLKSVEHSNRDRDNMMLFFDFTNHSLPDTKIFFTFLIDDIAISKIGKGWWGNQTLFNLGLQLSPFYNVIPIDVNIEYLRLEPYTYSHRLKRNNFTNFGYNLNDGLQPNSELFFAGINYRFTNRLTFAVDFTFTHHGMNIVNSDGTLVNVGGDINLGHRIKDSETTKFLSGDLEITRTFSANIYFEPIKQFVFFLNGTYSTISSGKIGSAKSSQVFLGSSLKF